MNNKTLYIIRGIFEILKSIAWIVGGSLLSYQSYQNAVEQAAIYGSARYMVFYGAIIYGVIRLFKSCKYLYEVIVDDFYW